MKKINYLISLALFVLAIGCVSCANSKNDPAIEFANEVNKITQLINDAKSLDDINALDLGHTQADKIIEENADYVLTDDDKTTIKKAMADFIRATMKKQAELSGTSISDQQIDEMAKSINTIIDAMKTLGDMEGGNSQNPETGVDNAESVDEGIATDSISE